jgi:hypothetical protein
MLGVALLRADRATHLTRRLDRDPAHMSDVVGRNEWRSKKVRDWLLAILRFAVTLRDEDRGGPGCLNRFSASISGASTKVRLPSGGAAA